MTKKKQPTQRECPKCHKWFMTKIKEDDGIAYLKCDFCGEIVTFESLGSSYEEE